MNHETPTVECDCEGCKQVRAMSDTELQLHIDRLICELCRRENASFAIVQLDDVTATERERMN